MRNLNEFLSCEITQNNLYYFKLYRFTAKITSPTRCTSMSHQPHPAEGHHLTAKNAKGAPPAKDATRAFLRHLQPDERTLAVEIPEFSRMYATRTRTTTTMVFPTIWSTRILCAFFRINLKLKVAREASAARREKINIRQRGLSRSTELRRWMTRRQRRARAASFVDDF